MHYTLIVFTVYNSEGAGILQYKNVIQISSKCTKVENVTCVTVLVCITYMQHSVLHSCTCPYSDKSQATTVLCKEQVISKLTREKNKHLNIYSWHGLQRQKQRSLPAANI